MHIGIPKEIKPFEGRVALIPSACADLVNKGHNVFIQADAGIAAGYSDALYEKIGVTVVPAADELYDLVEMLLKVKEPIDAELPLLKAHHKLFSYLHLAALPNLAKKLQEIGLTAIGFETVEDKRGRLPLLIPMSDIAGRISVQVGTHLLHSSQGGKGILLGGLAGVPRGHVVILGAGAAGGNAARLAANMGARVTVFDCDQDKLTEVRRIGPNVTALYSFQEEINETVPTADLLIGSVLIPGSKAPHLISREIVKKMEAGSVIIDIAVDQGGCIETTRPTTYEDPTYIDEGVVHFGVTNMPGAVPKSACYALSSALLPYVLMLAGDASGQSDGLIKGVNVKDGKVVHPALKASLGA